MNKKIISHLNNRSIVLVGMMGSGKTTIGKLLAEELKLPVYDSDNEIEKSLGKKINDIFKEHGELFFRNENLVESSQCFNSILKSKTSFGSISCPSCILTIIPTIIPSSNSGACF